MNMDMDYQIEQCRRRRIGCNFMLWISEIHVHSRCSSLSPSLNSSRI